MSTSANRRRRDVSFDVGALVHVSTSNFKLPIGLTRKFTPLFVGPFPVLARVGNVSYRVDLPPEYGNVHNVFHVSALKPHHGDAPRQRAAIFVPDVSHEEFEVDCLLDKRSRRNRVEYLVQWKGYGVYDATWEPEAHLKNASEAIRAFESRARPSRHAHAV